jgi:hypothetical protein
MPRNPVNLRPHSIIQSGPLKHRPQVDVGAAVYLSPGPVQQNGPLALAGDPHGSYLPPFHCGAVKGLLYQFA